MNVDAGQVEHKLRDVVRSTIEETLNAMLDAEADTLCGAKRYERSDERVDTRAGHYERDLQTQAGSVKLHVPKLRKLTFETRSGLKGDTSQMTPIFSHWQGELSEGIAQLFRGQINATSGEKRKSDEVVRF